jgi:hypothetical protein
MACDKQGVPLVDVKSREIREIGKHVAEREAARDREELGAKGAFQGPGTGRTARGPP